MKKCPDCKIELTKNYIKQPERLHAKDLSGVLDQIWAEETLC